MAGSKIYSELEELAAAIRGGAVNSTVRQDFGVYEVLFHNETIAGLARAKYKLGDLEKIEKLTRAGRQIEAVESVNGVVVPADAHDVKDVGFDTHYDSIWMRDSCWSYLGLRIQDAERARAVLETQVNYLAEQRGLIERLIKAPKEMDENNTIHIRFDSAKEGFGDVWENGAVQPWNHKQSDAVGLLLDLAVRGWREGFVEFSEEQIEVIILGFGYLAATRFWRQADAGPWEEAVRRNSSSIALCTSAFESLRGWVVADRGFKKSFRARCEKLGLERILSDKNLAQVIRNGYRVIRKQIGTGGESPGYNKRHPKYRAADAALLNVIFPARLPRLGARYKVRVLKIVAGLVREQGIIRYVGDTYQAGNFWFNDIHTDLDPAQLARRVGLFRKGSEAEWFFDSWYSICALEVYRATRDEEFLYLATKHFNRALGQYTGEGDYKANGHPCGAMELPESYNFLMTAAGEKLAAASPMTPLNWAKAAQEVMMERWREFLER